MPQFVPVYDTEKPKSEQTKDDPTLLKHRQWDAPHVKHVTNLSNSDDLKTSKADAGRTSGSNMPGTESTYSKYRERKDVTSHKNKTKDRDVECRYDDRHSKRGKYSGEFNDQKEKSPRDRISHPERHKEDKSSATKTINEHLETYDNEQRIKKRERGKYTEPCEDKERSTRVRNRHSEQCEDGERIDTKYRNRHAEMSRDDERSEATYRHRKSDRYEDDKSSKTRDRSRHSERYEEDEICSKDRYKHSPEHQNNELSNTKYRNNHPERLLDDRRRETTDKNRKSERYEDDSHARKRDRNRNSERPDDNQRDVTRDKHPHLEEYDTGKSIKMDVNRSPKRYENAECSRPSERYDDLDCRKADTNSPSERCEDQKASPAAGEMTSIPVNEPANVDQMSKTKPGFKAKDGEKALMVAMGFPVGFMSSKCT